MGQVSVHYTSTDSLIHHYRVQKLLMQVYICTICQQLHVLETADTSLHFAHLHQPLLGLKAIYASYILCTILSQLMTRVYLSHILFRFCTTSTTTLKFRYRSRESTFRTIPSTTTGFRGCLHESTLRTIPSTAPGLEIVCAKYYREQQGPNFGFKCHRLLQNPALSLHPLHTIPLVTTEPSTAFKSSLRNATGYYRTLHCLREISRGLAIWFKDFPHNTSGYYRAGHCLRGMCGGPASGTKELGEPTPPCSIWQADLWFPSVNKFLFPAETHFRFPNSIAL